MALPERQVLVCMNERDPSAGRPSCRGEGARKLKDELKDAVKAAGLKGKVRVLEVSCMDQCEHAAVCAVYPDNVWYSFTRARDVEEIVQQHLLGNAPVERLLWQNPTNQAKADQIARNVAEGEHGYLLCSITSCFFLRITSGTYRGR